jgi:protein TonB
MPKYEYVYNHGEQISTTKEKNATLEETMPMFSGCHNLGLTKKEETTCAEKRMLQFIYNNIRYPEADRKRGTEGRALVSFVIEKDGSVQDIKVLRGITKTIKQECLRVVNKMPKWIPGTQDGEPVRVQFSLPISFKLE